MIKEFVKSLVSDCQRIIVAKVLMGLCLVFGLMSVLMLLAILLMITYPAYVWCVWGGYFFVWVVAMLILYANARITKAECCARSSEVDSLDNYVHALTTVAIKVIDVLSKKHK